MGNNAQCSSTAGSFAVALGPTANVSASSSGLFDGAVANGLGDSGAQFTEASSTGNLSFAYAQGPNTLAETDGNLNVAAAVGSNNAAFAGFSPGDNGNVSLNLSNNTNGNYFTDVTEAGGNFLVPGSTGSGNIAANLGGVPTATQDTFVSAIGNGNSAFNLLGNGNLVEAGSPGLAVLTPGPTFNPGSSTLSSAFSGPGSNNVVQAGPGPFSIAGVFSSSNNNGTGTNPPAVQQLGTGLHVIP